MSIFTEPPLRDDLRDLEPYGAPQLAVAVRLDHTANTYPIPDAAGEAIEKALRAQMRELSRYPDREAIGLREDLSSYLGYGLTTANIWLGNGSYDVIQQVLLAFGGPGRTALGFLPAPPVHQRLAQLSGTHWVDGHRSSTFELTVEGAKAQVRVHQPDVVILARPNNPTGTAMSLDVVDAVAAEAPGVVVVDEAFFEFAQNCGPSAVSLVERHPRLVVTRTLSKAFGLAGVHLAYLAASRQLVEALRRACPPNHLSALTQAAARAGLAHATTLLGHVEAIRMQRDRIAVGLWELGLTVADSDANFLLFGRFRDHRRVLHALADRGVLVRDVGLPGWLRVCAGTPAEADTFLTAMSLVPAGA
jgi:histidinol-phosphate aminotransferase